MAVRVFIRHHVKGPVNGFVRLSEEDSLHAWYTNHKLGELLTEALISEFWPKLSTLNARMLANGHSRIGPDFRCQFHR